MEVKLIPKTRDVSEIQAVDMRKCQECAVLYRLENKKRWGRLFSKFETSCDSLGSDGACCKGNCLSGCDAV
jgi:hypothetical protein